MLKLAVLLLALVVSTALAEAQTKTAIVSFTFDDAPDSVVSVGLPVLDKAGFKATLYVSIRNTTHPGYMNWDDVKTVANHGWEIGAHTYTHPHLTKLSDDEIEQELKLSDDELKVHGYTPLTFASPFGAYDDRVVAILKRHYQSHRAAWPSAANTLKPDPWAIASYGLTSDIKIEEIDKVLENLQKDGGWVVFQMHHLFPKGEEVTEEYGTNLLEEIVQRVQSKGFAVLTVSDALHELMKGD